MAFDAILTSRQGNIRAVRDGPLENLWEGGGGRAGEVQKKNRSRAN